MDKKNVILLHQRSFCYIRTNYFSNINIHIHISIMSLKTFRCGRIFSILYLFLTYWYDQFDKGIKNGCPCIVDIGVTQGCALVKDPARTVGECRDVAKAQPWRPLISTIHGQPFLISFKTWNIKIRQNTTWIDADIPCINLTLNRYNALTLTITYVSNGVTIPFNSMRSQ